MATIDWPRGLRPALKASKSREQVVGFRESSPTAGPSYVEPFSGDTPSLYNVQFTFTGAEAAAFQSWLRFYKIRTFSPFFNFPIKVEGLYTPATQEARFTGQGYPQLTGESGATYTYSAQMLIREIKVDDATYDDFLLQLGEGTGFMQQQFISDFDIVVNS